MTPLKNLKNNELDIAAKEQVPIFNEKFFVLLGVDTFLHFKALFAGYAMECAKPEQIIIDEQFIQRVTGAVIKKRVLQVSVPEIYDVSIQGSTGVYFLLSRSRYVSILFVSDTKLQIVQKFSCSDGTKAAIHALEHNRRIYGAQLRIIGDFMDVPKVEKTKHKNFFVISYNQLVPPPDVCFHTKNVLHLVFAVFRCPLAQIQNTY